MFKNLVPLWIQKIFRVDDPDLSRNYMDSEIPKKQRQLVDQQLKEMYLNEAPKHFLVLSEVFSEIKETMDPLRILDAGCASGYYSEILSYLIPRPLNYIGADYNSSTLEMARQKYPYLPFFRMDLQNIALKDSTFDVVLTGAVIVHIRDWGKVITEIARISKKWIILHRTRVNLNDPTMIRRELHYDVEVYRVSINENELLSLLDKVGFILIRRFECDEGGLDQGLGNFTYLFSRKDH